MAAKRTRTRPTGSPEEPPLSWPADVVAWFRQHQRQHLPWRSDPTPYRVWISEIMLQQTRVETVRPYFERFLERFPSVAELAAADTQEVLKLWQGLGYYSRARNLHRAAHAIVAEHGGELPNTLAGLRSLPGFGPYTAAAVASIAFGLPAPVVDGNVLRFGARLYGIDADIKKPRTRDDLTKRLQPAIEASGDPAAFNQGIMEIGGRVCTPRSPACEACPVRVSGPCIAYRDGRTAELPVKSSAKPRPHKEVAVGIVERRGKILVARRRDDQMLGGLWEFPGGKIEPGESPRDTVIRELHEETGLTVEPDAEPLIAVDHGFSHFTLRIHAYLCRAATGRAKAISAAEIKWLPRSELRALPWPKANGRILDALLGPGEAGD